MSKYSKKSHTRSYTGQLKLPKYVQKEVDIKSLNSMRKNLMRKTKLNKYLELKEKYSISTYTYRDLKKLGASRADIVKYYQRELDLLTGAYERARQQLFVDNYYKAMLTSGIDIDIANKVYDKMLTYVGTTTKKFEKMTNNLDDIGLYYAKRGYEIQEELIEGVEENLNEFIEME